MFPHLLTWMIFIPLLAVPIIMFLPSRWHNAIKITSAIFTGLQLLLAVHTFIVFDRVNPLFQFTERASWIPSFNVEYFLGIDGISVVMVLLTPLICFLGTFVSWNINKGVKGYFILFLLLDTGMMGVFCALDFFLFYVFWEVMLLPMYFLIGIWGGPRKEYAAIKFFLYTLAGSVLMLLVMLAFYFVAKDPNTGAPLHTFDMTKLMELRGAFTGTFWLWCFGGLFIAFAIKVPVFPFHTWLPDAHVEAPTAISVILAGILLKMGVYGMLRICFPILPEAANYFAFWIALLGVINIVYGALCSMAQKDLKKLVAYSSVSHMGYCLLGMAALTPAGMTGAVMQMFNHGCITGMLFIIVGVIYDRAHHRDINGFGGLASRMPVYTAITSLAFFASLGLPGLSGFISEILVFLGAFSVYKTLTIIAVSGVVLTAGYLLWTMQRVFLGPLNPKYETISEINGREMFTLVPLGLIVIIVGVYPSVVIDLTTSSINYLLGMVK